MLSRRVRGAVSVVIACLVALPAFGAAPAAAAQSFVGVGAPKVIGTAAVGKTLTSKRDRHSRPTAARVTHQWRRDGRKIEGATGPSYRAVTADAGQRLSLTVCYKKSGVTTRCLTSKKTAVPALKKLTAGTPSIKGSPTVDVTVKAVHGAWTVGTSFSYQWFRDGRAIPGSISAKRTLTVEDKGHRISVRVTGRRTGYATTSRTSAPTMTVTALTDRQREAMEVAEYTYLATGLYSRAELIGRLRADGYSAADAVAAVDSIGVSWARQALSVAKATAASGRVSEARLRTIIHVDRRFTMAQTDWALAHL